MSVVLGCTFSKKTCSFFKISGTVPARDREGVLPQFDSGLKCRKKSMEIRGSIKSERKQISSIEGHRRVKEYDGF